MSTYRVTVDTFQGPPCVRVWRTSGEQRIHHVRELSRLDAYMKEWWGEKAGCIRHLDGMFTVVWCDLEPAPFPGQPTGYGLREFTISVDMA